MGSTRMTDEILFEDTGLTIKRLSAPGTMVPRPRNSRPDGSIDYGWLDLRDRPDLVDSVPEARKHEALAELLRAVAVSPDWLSIGCECTVNERGDHWTATCNVDLTGRHEDQPSSFEDVKGLTNAIVSGLRNTPPGMACGYVMEIAPLKLFFAHRTGAHALTVWISGSGPDEETARRSLAFGLGLITDGLRGGVSQSS